MWNMIVADLKRIILRGDIWFWGTFIVSLMMPFIFLSMSSLYMSEEGLVRRAVTGNELLRVIIEPNLFFFLLFSTIISLVISDENSGGRHGEGTIKNVISSGFSRTKYYFAKSLNIIIIGFIFYFMNVIVGVLIGSTLSGFGEIFDYDIFLIIPSQLFAFVGVLSLFISLAFLISRTEIFVQVFCLLLVGPGFIYNLLGQFFEGNAIVERIGAFDLLSIFARFSHVSEMSTSDLLSSLLIVLAYMIVPTAIGLTVFNKREIK